VTSGLPAASLPQSMLTTADALLIAHDDIRAAASLVSALAVNDSSPRIA